MKEFKGIYLGLSPTDESAIGLGEVELVIGEKIIKVRIATGLEILEQEYLVSDFRQMTPEELARSLGSRPDPGVKATAFKHSSNFPELWFLQMDGSASIVLRLATGGIGELLGPTILVDSTKGTKDYDLMVGALEESAGKGVLPRLRNSGKAEC